MQFPSFGRMRSQNRKVGISGGEPGVVFLAGDAMAIFAESHSVGRLRSIECNLRSNR
jgi:hypothetical protein